MEISDLHALREAKRKLRDLVFKYPAGGSSFYSGLKSTEWLSQLRQIFDAASKVANFVTAGTTTIVQCSDGVDRTTQVVSLAQILLDPYYRTIRGFGTLIEKEWCSYGFRFRQRDGLGKAENSECSPVFLQFIDAIFQVMLQFPSSFEYNETYLIDVIDELYASRTGTFLSISEHERNERLIPNKTLSLWTLLDNNKEYMSYINPLYRTRQSHNMLAPKTGSSHILFWKGFYMRHGNVEVDQLGLGIQNITVPMNLYQAPLPANEQNRARAISTNVAITKAFVTKSFEAEEDDQISLSEGQVIFVLEESNPKFWFVSTTPSRICVGYFPKDHLKVINRKQSQSRKLKGGWVSASHSSKTQNSPKFLLHQVQQPQQQQQSPPSAQQSLSQSLPPQQQQQQPILGSRSRTVTTVDPPAYSTLDKDTGHSRSKSDSGAGSSQTAWERAKKEKFLRPQRPMYRENTVTIVVKWKVFPKIKHNKKQLYQSTMPTHATFMSSSSSSATLPFITSPRSPSIQGTPTSPALKFTPAGQVSHKRGTSRNTSSNFETTIFVDKKGQKSPQYMPSMNGTPPNVQSPFSLSMDN